jgi:hypothetical protein
MSLLYHQIQALSEVFGITEDIAKDMLERDKQLEYDEGEDE